MADTYTSHTPMAITGAELGHGDIRVQDYLDDRLQTGADLDSLDSLLENVRTQQGLLRKQVIFILHPT